MNNKQQLEQLNKTDWFSIIVLILILIIIVTLITIILYIFSTQDNFCKNEGYKGINDDAKCEDKNKISKERVDCNLNIFDMECFWEKTKIVVEETKQ